MQDIPSNIYPDILDISTQKKIFRVIEQFSIEHQRKEDCLFEYVDTVTPYIQTLPGITAIYVRIRGHIQFQIDISNENQIIRVVRLWDLSPEYVQEHVEKHKYMYSSCMHPFRLPYILPDCNSMYILTQTGSILFSEDNTVCMHNETFKSGWILDIWPVSKNRWVVCTGVHYQYVPSNPLFVDEVNFIEIDIDENIFREIAPAIEVSYTVQDSELEFLGAWIDPIERKGYVAVFHHPLNVIENMYSHVLYKSNKSPYDTEYQNIPPPLLNRTKIHVVDV
jgi:hypothetical protein